MGIVMIVVVFIPPVKETVVDIFDSVVSFPLQLLY
jgi:hypothetical protein